MSLAARVAGMDETARAKFYADLSEKEIEALEWTWEFWARADQLPPEGSWRCWCLLGGRGSGKTRSASEAVRAEVEAGRRKHIAIIGPTADALRRVQIEGPSGLLAVCPPWSRPEYEPSIRRLTWSNGATASIFSGEEPDRLRGMNADFAWIDELCSMPSGEEVLIMLQMALRLPGPLGHPPKMIVTTTPRNLGFFRSLLASPSTVISRSKTSDNVGNLDADTVAFLNERYGGTSLGRQELDAELIADSEGALWTRDLIERTRVKTAPEHFKRVIVAIDPAGGSGRTNDETGLIVAGRSAEGHGYILADLSGRYTPQQWATKAIEAFRRHKADRIVAETNFGAAMVENTLRTVWPGVPFRGVRASRGKAIRAEPIVALFEQGKAHVVGQQPQLEDQMCSWEPLTSRESPDRIDAMVWALTELMLTSGAPARRIFLDVFSR